MYSRLEKPMAAPITKPEVSLNDWDIVNAGTFAAVNNGIQLQSSTPANFSLLNAPMGTARLSGAWNTWKLVDGGDGKTVAIEMPIKSGTASELKLPLNYAELASGAGVTGNSVSAPAGNPRAISAFSTVTADAGKIYFEVRNSGAAGSAARVLVGLARDNNTLQWDRSIPSFVFRSDGYVSNGSVQVPVGKNKDWNKPNDTIGVAVDFATGSIWLRGSDGTWLGTGSDPSTGTAPVISGFDVTAPYFVAVKVEAGAAATINLDGKAWAYSPVPMGFTPGLIDVVASSDNTSLAGATVNASISFKKTGTPTTKTKLMVEDVGTVSTPAVTVNSVTLMNGRAATGPVVQAFNQALNAQIGQFINIFHIIDESDQVEDTMKWMTPVLSDYAVADLKDANGALRTSVLAILNKTSANKGTKPLVAQVDPNIVASLPVGADAVVAISAERFTEQVLLPGAMAIAGGADISSFEITDLNRKVKNKIPLAFGDIKLNTAPGSPELTVNPTIPAGGMTLSVEGRSILIQYTGLSFPYDNVALGKQETVTFGFDQRLYLESKKRTDGHHVLFPTLDDPLNPKGDGATGMSNFQISISLTPGQIAADNAKASQTTSIIIGCVVGGIVLLAVGGGVLYWCCADAGAAAAADGAGAAAVAGDGVAAAPIAAPVYDIIPNMAQGDLVANIYEAADSPLQFVVTSGGPRPFATKPAKPMTAGQLPFRAKWALGFAHLNTMASIQSSTDLGMTASDLKQLAKGNFDTLGIEATVEKFVEAALKPFDWPQTKGWAFVDAELNGSLLIYGKITSK